MLGIVTIRFNHGAPETNIGHALNVRKNQFTPALIPEWQAGMSGMSVAAYVGDAVRGKVIGVRAAFVQLGSIVSPLQIRAVAAQLDGSALQFSALPLLGSLEDQMVDFDSAGRSEEVLFRCLSHRVPEAGVNVQTLAWRWEARLNQYSPWLPFAITPHKIFTLLRAPTPPWTQAPFDVQNETLPWTDMLEVACSWAAGATTEPDAIARITRCVNGLGGSLLQYDCAGGGASHYVPPATNFFDGSAFLERLVGGLGRGGLVNCVDCATIVSTLANLVGCDLSQSRMGMQSPFFACNPIVAIGAPDWETPCGLPGFFFHEVAWSGDCNADDQVSDACLQIDSDEDPTSAPHRSLVATNEVFGHPGDGNYRDRLAAPAGRESCEPQPNMRQRRSIAAAASTQTALLPEVATKALADTYSGALESSPGPSRERFFWRFFFTGDELPGWSLISSFRSQDAGSDPSSQRFAHVEQPAPFSLLRSIWLGDNGKQLIHIDSYECISQDGAQQLIVRILGEFQLPSITPGTGTLGELHFRSARNGAILFKVGNHVHLVRGEGGNRVDVSAPTESLVAHLRAGETLPSRGHERQLQISWADDAPLVHSFATAIPPTRWYKFFSGSGEFRVRFDRVTFHPGKAGTHQISVLTVDPFESTAAIVRVLAI